MLIGIACKIFIKISGDPTTFFDYILKVSFMVGMFGFVNKDAQVFLKYNKMMKDKEKDV
ncbi:MAG: hypothetical protein ACRC5R_01440 [Mycoplasmatales bacterium]